MSDLAIETRGLVKGYGQVEAVNGLSLSMPRGAIYALVGRNGSGKTTTIRSRGLFLLTRPRLRRFFVWSDSGFSFGLMAALAWGLTLLFVLLALVNVLRFPPGRALSPVALLLVPLSGVVFAGLIYAVTYVCTVLISLDKTARVIYVAVLIAYSYLVRKGLPDMGWCDAVFVPQLVGGSVSESIQFCGCATFLAADWRAGDCDTGAVDDGAIGAGTAGDSSVIQARIHP